MAIPHLKPAEVADLRPLGAAIAETRTHTLVKTPTLEVIRLVLPAGKTLPSHKAPGEITVQCLEGKVEFSVEDSPRELTAGALLYLEASVPHAVRAIDDSSVLVTLLLPPKG
jgi:quercetin dioxygenase-like cupin family protein